MRALALAFLLLLVSPAVAQTSRPRVEDAWIMTPPPGATEAAAYMLVRGARGDRLLSVSCECAARAELHDMRSQDGVMIMRALPYGMAPAPTGVLRLSPSGAHIMLVGLAAPLTDGARVPLRLTFRSAGVVPVTAIVRRR